MASRVAMPQDATPGFSPYDDQFLISDPIFLSNPLSKASQRDAENELAMATDGINTMLIWLELENDGRSYAINRVIVDPFGSVLPESRIRYQGSRQLGGGAMIVEPEIVWAGSHYLIAWTEWTPRKNQGWYLRIDRNGHAIDQRAKRIALLTAPVSERQVSLFAQIQMAYDGHNSMAVFRQGNVRKNEEWVSGTGFIHGVRINADGQVSEPFVVYKFEELEPGSSAQHSLGSMVFDGQDYLFLSKDIVGGRSASVDASRISRSGEQVSWQSIDLWEGPTTNNEIASSNNGLCAAWIDYKNRDVTPLRAAMINKNSSQQELKHIVLDPSANYSSVYALSVSSNGRAYFATWSREYDNTPIELTGRIITQDGELKGPEDFIIAEGHRVFGQVSGNEWGYVIAYVSHGAIRRDYKYEARFLVDKQRYMFLSDPIHRQGGGIQFEFTGVPGESYHIEGSENMNSWSEVMEIQNYDSPTKVEDTGTSKMRFYRARHLP